MDSSEKKCWKNHKSCTYFHIFFHLNDFGKICRGKSQYVLLPAILILKKFLEHIRHLFHEPKNIVKKTYQRIAQSVKLKTDCMEVVKGMMSVYLFTIQWPSNVGRTRRGVIYPSTSHSFIIHMPASSIYVSLFINSLLFRLARFCLF